MTRIVAGKYGGRVLSVPGSGTRPTSERVREALFSRLDHLGVVDGARVLDGYAGSGALGLEAASRGARHVTLVEKNPKAAAVCRANVASLRAGAEVQVLVADVGGVLAGQPHLPVGPVDLLLLDPPYDVTNEQLATVLAGAAQWLTDAGVLVLERAGRSGEPPLPVQLRALQAKKYGDTVLYFCERA